MIPIAPGRRDGGPENLRVGAVEDVLRTVENFGYDQQFALMREVLRKLKMSFTAAGLVFVEKTPPHCVRVVELSDEDLDAGEAKNRIALRRFATCWNSEEVAGTGGERQDAETLNWHRRQRTSRRPAQETSRGRGP